MPLSPAEQAELDSLELRDLETRAAQAPQAIEASAKPTSPISKTETALRDAAQGATAGFADEGAARVEHAIAGLSALTGIGPQDVAQKVLFTPEEKLAAEHRADFEAAHKANPGTGAVFNIAGALPRAIATGGLAGPVTSAVVEGAVSGAGGAKPGERLAGSLTGAATGFLVGKAVKAATGASKAALEALGGRLGFGKSALNEIGSDVKADKLVQALRDEGVGMRGMSPEALTEDVSKVVKRVGPLLENTYSKIPGALTTSQTLADDIAKEVAEPLANAGKRVNQAELTQVSDWLADLKDKFPQNTELNAKMLWELKKDLQEKAWEAGNLGLQKVWKALSDKLTVGASKAAPELSDALTKANLTYTAAKQAEKSLESKIASRRASSAIDAIHPYQMVKKAIGKNLKETGAYVGNVIGRAGDKISALMDDAVLSKLPEGARRALASAKDRGPAAFAAMWYTIIHQYPGLGKAVNDADEESVNEPQQ